MKKILIVIGITIISLINNIHHTTYAEEVSQADPKTGNHATVLPDIEANTDCEDLMNKVNKQMTIAEKALAKRTEFEGKTNNTMLGCAIKTGNVRFFMIPFFIRYILEFIIYVVGFLSILGIIYGGYNYLFAGLSEDKDSGKNAIKNSLIGLVLSVLAWPIVNIILSLLS